MSTPTRNTIDEVPPETFSWNEVPVHSSAYPSGSACRATSSIAASASPEL